MVLMKTQFRRRISQPNVREKAVVRSHHFVDLLFYCHYLQCTADDIYIDFISIYCEKNVWMDNSRLVPVVGGPLCMSGQDGNNAMYHARFHNHLITFHNRFNSL